MNARPCGAFIIFFTLVAGSFSGCSSSEPLTCLFTESQLRSGSPDFTYDTFSYPSERASRLELFLQVGYFVLNFTKDSEGYSARYTASVTFLSDDELVKSEAWTEALHVTSFDETRGRTYNVSRRLFQLNPGSYRLTVEIVDENSLRRLQKFKTVVVPNYAKQSVAVSSPTVGTRRIQEDRYVLPAVNREIVDGSDTVYVQFEVKSSKPTEELRVTYRLTFSQRKASHVAKPEFHEPFPGRLEEVDTSSIVVDTVVTTTDHAVVLQRPFEIVRNSSCRLNVVVQPANAAVSTDSTIAVATRGFVVRPVGFPDVISIDDQILPLVYIATDAEFQTLEKANTGEEKKQLLQEFWSDHVDRDLFYERIRYANRYFTCKNEGWMTFPGYIYIVVGPPDYVECFPGVERWVYTSPSLDIRFQWRQEVEGDRECRFTDGYIDPIYLDRYVARWRK